MISDPKNVVSIEQKGCYCSDITASRDLRYEPLRLLNERQRSAYRLPSAHLPLHAVGCLSDYYILQADLKRPHVRQPSFTAFTEVLLKRYQQEKSMKLSKLALRNAL